MPRAMLLMLMALSLRQVAMPDICRFCCFLPPLIFFFFLFFLISILSAVAMLLSIMRRHFLHFRRLLSPDFSMLISMPLSISADFADAQPINARHNNTRRFFSLLLPRFDARLFRHAFILFRFHYALMMPPFASHADCFC